MLTFFNKSPVELDEQHEAAVLYNYSHIFVDASPTDFLCLFLKDLHEMSLGWLGFHSQHLVLLSTRII